MEYNYTLGYKAIIKNHWRSIFIVLEIRAKHDMKCESQYSD